MHLLDVRDGVSQRSGVASRPAARISSGFIAPPRNEAGPCQCGTRRPAVPVLAIGGVVQAGGCFLGRPRFGA